MRSLHCSKCRTNGREGQARCRPGRAGSSREHRTPSLRMKNLNAAPVKGPQAASRSHPVEQSLQYSHLGSGSLLWRTGPASARGTPVGIPTPAQPVGGFFFLGNGLPASPRPSMLPHCKDRSLPSRRRSSWRARMAL